MNQLKDILDQLKADTRDRSTMVMLLVAAAVLVVAVAWVAMGSSTTPMTPKPAPVAATLPAAPTRQVADHAAKERKRHAVRAKRSRPARDPFEAIYIETKTEQGSGKSESKGGASKNVPAPGWSRWRLEHQILQRPDEHQRIHAGPDESHRFGGGDGIRRRDSRRPR